jgi:thiamine-phosphate pyrophosphorylase
MQRCQSWLPRQWLIADERAGEALIDIVRRLPHGSGVLLLHHGLAKGKRERLVRTIRRLSRSRRLTLMDEAAGGAARVHNAREMARARLKGGSLILLSPMYPTRSHPDWRPLSRMQAAALMRLARAPVLALGGMDEKRFAQVKALGFHGWAGIDAWLKRDPRT